MSEPSRPHSHSATPPRNHTATSLCHTATHPHASIRTRKSACTCVHLHAIVYTLFCHCRTTAQQRDSADTQPEPLLHRRARTRARWSKQSLLVTRTLVVHPNAVMAHVHVCRSWLTINRRCEAPYPDGPAAINDADVRLAFVRSDSHQAARPVPVFHEGPAVSAAVFDGDADRYMDERPCCVSHVTDTSRMHGPTLSADDCSTK